MNLKNVTEEVQETRSTFWSPLYRKDDEGMSSFRRSCNKTLWLQGLPPSEVHLCQCDYPATKHKRKGNWSAKVKTHNTKVTGLTRHLKIVHHRFRHGFHQGTMPKPQELPHPVDPKKFNNFGPGVVA